jgi:Spy/CpxP family protein refolding chaperone
MENFRCKGKNAGSLHKLPVVHQVASEVTMIRLIACAAMLLTAVAAVGSTESPYAGTETREIKALSAQEIAEYLNGGGLGFARAAELNRFPGPRHVLELAGELELTAGQAARTKAIFNAMKSRATSLGEALVARERTLDQQFADGSIEKASLQELMSAIGELQSEIRYVHLHAHLEQKSLLTKHQVRLYDELRGYWRTTDGAAREHSH